MRILSLDLGVKSLGFCVSDEKNIIAIPLENFIFERNDFDQALKRVVYWVEKYDVGKILLGYPLKTNGKETEITFIVKDFCEKIKEKLNIEIKLYDERFSTQRGIELLKRKYKDKNKIKELKDLAASYIMLNDYLIFNNKTYEE